MNMIDMNNQNLNSGSISSSLSSSSKTTTTTTESTCCSRQVVFPDDEHAHMDYENQVEGKLKCLIQKRSNTNVSKMLSSNEFNYEQFKYQFPKSEPIYINHENLQTPVYSSYSSSSSANSSKNVFSSSSSSSACSTSPSPSQPCKSFEDNEDDEQNTSRNKQGGRGNRFFPDNVVDILNKWFFDNQDYPYPDENMTNTLAREANISAKQVRKWFANKRVRSNKCYKQTFRTKLINTTPCSSLTKQQSRRTKSVGDQDQLMNDESDCENNLSLNNLSQSQSPFQQQDNVFSYENLIRNFHQQQQLNMIQNAIYNTTVIANLLQQNSQTTPPQSNVGVVKRKTHLSNCFINDQLMNESPVKLSSPIDTDETVFKQEQEQQQNMYYQFQYQLQQLIQHQHNQQQQQQQQQQQTQHQLPQQCKKPKVNFGLISDLI